MAAMLIGWYFVENQVLWDEFAFNLPDNIGTLTFKRRSIHPFLAEYERKVSFNTSNGPSDFFRLTTNTGGRTYINCYLLTDLSGKPKWIQLKDRFGIYLFNFSTKEGHLLGNCYGKTFIGSLRDGKYFSCLKNVIDNNVEIEGHVGRGPAKEAKELESLNISYIGTIDGNESHLRFVSASEKEEIPIKTMYEKMDKETSAVEPGA